MACTSIPFATLQDHGAPPHSLPLVAERPCPICRSKSRFPILTLDEFQFFTDQPDLCPRVPIQHVRCGQCFTLFMNPCFTEQGFTALFEKAACSYGASPGRYAEQVQWLADHGLLQAGFTLADIGCYQGAFIAQLPDHLSCVGVDIDARSIAKAQTLHGAAHRKFHVADFEAFDIHLDADVITLFHVLEHLPRPVATLKALRKKARASTRLVIEVPILERAKTLDINGFLTVSHLTHFSSHSLDLCLQCAGWTRIHAAQPEGYNGYRVIAQPSNPDHTKSGHPGDLALLQDYLAHWYGALARVSSRIHRKITRNHVVIWGAGLHTEWLFHVTPFFQTEPHRRFLLVDTDPLKQGHTWRGVPIRSPQILSDVCWERTQLLVSSYGNQEEIRQQALSLGVPDPHITRLYDTIHRY